MKIETDSLYYYLSQIKDHRRKKSRRHELAPLLCIFIMASLSGFTGLRAFARFAKRHEELFATHFSMKHGVPCYQTLRVLLMNVSFEELNNALFLWTNHHFPLEQETYLSFDGKALSSTITDSNGSDQSYLSLVSMFGQRTGLVYCSQEMESKKANEPEIVRSMLERLSANHDVDVSGLNLRVDAIHCQKKHLLKAVKAHG